MEDYNPLERFKQRNENEAGNVNVTATVNNDNNVNFDKPINAKLKQFYNLKEKVEPFYTGGRICILSPCHFLCRCGPAVKAIATPSAIKKTDPDAVSGIDSGIEDEDLSNLEKRVSFRVYGTFEVDMDEIISFDACPVTSTLITAHKSKLIRKWDIHTQKVIQAIKSFHAIPIGIVEINKGFSMMFNGNSKFDLMIQAEGRQEDERKQLMWATVAGSCVKVWNDGGSAVSKNIIIPNVPSVGFVKWKNTSQNDRNNVLAVAERHIYLIELDKTTVQFNISQILEGHYSQVTGIEWLDSGRMISAGRDKIMILWNSNANGGIYEKLQSFVMPGEIESTHLFSAHDLYILTSSPTTIRHFNTSSHQVSSKDVLTWTDDEAITGSFSVLPHRDQLEEIYITAHSGSIYRVGRKQSSETSSKNKILLQINQQYVGHLDEIYSVVIWEQTTETKIAVANNTAIIKVYDMSFGNCTFLKGHQNTVVALATHEEWLVSGSKDHRVLVWTASSPVPVYVLEGHMKSVNSVHISPLSTTDPIIYSVSEDNFIRSWKLGKCIRSAIAHDKEVNVVNCSPNGSLLITGSRDKTAKVWVAESLDLVGVLKGHKKTVWDAQFSNWDQLIVTSSADCTLKIWNLVSMTCIKTLQGHDGSVLAGTFVNSGLQVLSASSDGTWKAWDIRDSICVSTSECSEEGRVWTLSATSDGSLVVTGTADSNLSLWEDVTQQKVDEKLAKQKKSIEDEQELSNVIRQGEWKRAIYLAIELDRPFALLRIVRGIQHVTQLEPIIGKLSTEKKSKLVKYIAQWNTNTRTSTEGQILLKIILESTSPSELRNLPISSLISYTEKHFQRLERYEQVITLLNHFANKS